MVVRSSKTRELYLDADSLEADGAGSKIKHQESSKSSTCSSSRNCFFFSRPLIYSLNISAPPPPPPAPKHGMLSCIFYWKKKSPAVALLSCSESQDLDSSSCVSFCGCALASSIVSPPCPFLTPLQSTSSSTGFTGPARCHCPFPAPPHHVQLYPRLNCHASANIQLRRNMTAERAVIPIHALPFLFPSIPISSSPWMYMSEPRMRHEAPSHLRGRCSRPLGRRPAGGCAGRCIASSLVARPAGSPAESAPWMFIKRRASLCVSHSSVFLPVWAACLEHVFFFASSMPIS